MELHKKLLLNISGVISLWGCSEKKCLELLALSEKVIIYWTSWQIVPLLLHTSWGWPTTPTWTQSFSLAGGKCRWDWKYPEYATKYLLPHPKQMWHTWLNRAAESEDHLLSDSAYLQHDRADVSYTLSDGLWSAGDCDSPLCRVRQHVSCHLNLSACGLNIARQQKKQRLFIAEKSAPSPKLKCCFKHPQITLNTFWHAGSSCKPNSNVCSNIWRGVHKYCPFRMSIQPPSIFTSIISGIFMSSHQKNTHICKQRKTRKVWLGCLILEVSEQQGGGFLSPFGCRKTTSW